MISADSYYVADTGGLQQGDVLLSGIARIVAEDGFSPDQWEFWDSQLIEVEAIKPDGNPLRFYTGFGLVMVTSHDCQLEKEWNRRRSELIAGGKSDVDASAEATADPTLDRTLVVSPLVSVEDIKVDRGQLLAGHVVGYVPVPASNDGLVPECVVDLSYRCTVDRFDVVRISSVSTLARSQLRYALVRLDSLRTPHLGFGIEDVIGRTIERAEVPQRDPLTVRLHLDDGSVINLLQQPGEPRGPSARSSIGPPEQ
jgi:hypothetical protein